MCFFAGARKCIAAAVLLCAAAGAAVARSWNAGEGQWEYGDPGEFYQYYNQAAKAYPFVCIGIVEDDGLRGFASAAIDIGELFGWGNGSVILMAVFTDDAGAFNFGDISDADAGRWFRLPRQNDAQVSYWNALILNMDKYNSLHVYDDSKEFYDAIAAACRAYPYLLVTIDDKQARYPAGTVGAALNGSMLTFVYYGNREVMFAQFMNARKGGDGGRWFVLPEQEEQAIDYWFNFVDGL